MFVFVRGFQKIEANRILCVCGIHIYHVFHPFFGDSFQKVVNERPVRINDRESFAIANILHDHIFKKR
ncbi:MAG: hypothetical protein A3I31_01865 [Candidatus Colwellbacteria bacterium RIFCSPLOWO2_02_FULL_44_20b]|uniref:Uncharacterized protein n=1 Tax=Candidatus Colwellbacteria bacterium RIFCSPLOWO2_02_FULL_44_20b TaxID=1797691 RepID=A0A1G1Z625_9BACT|nr:MAG: hypothetical protein A3I31_01865 [Candidatus Colwellbacteria bacterium RIFCSPLOWO2_02_FULL_44_20b]